MEKQPIIKKRDIEWVKETINDAANIKMSDDRKKAILKKLARFIDDNLLNNFTEIEKKECKYINSIELHKGHIEWIKETIDCLADAKIRDDRKKEILKNVIEFIDDNLLNIFIKKKEEREYIDDSVYIIKFL